MKINKSIEKNQISTTTEAGEKILLQPSFSEASKPTSKVGASSQMQLLNMAKQFSLEGGLLTAEKQMPIEDRSLRRGRYNQIRKQQNMEVIIKKALGYCSENEIPDRADKDWFNSYIDLAEDISNKTMQDLWAKILAGEISHPGSYSLKALKVFRDMSIHDAKLLAKACALAVKDHSRKNIRILSGAYQKPGLFNLFDKARQLTINLSHFGLNYADLLTLAENKLIFMQESESNLIAKQEELHFSYNGIPLNLVGKKANCIISFYKFTPIGSELAHLISDKPDTEFLSVMQQQLSHHFIVTSDN